MLRPLFWNTILLTLAFKSITFLSSVPRRLRDDDRKDDLTVIGVACIHLYCIHCPVKAALWGDSEQIRRTTKITQRYSVVTSVLLAQPHEMKPSLRHTCMAMPARNRKQLNRIITAEQVSHARWDTKFAIYSFLLSPPRLVCRHHCGC